LNSYPKEWLVNEIERDEALKYDLTNLRTFEPWWKLILGNKALLPLLWSMYPGHPNLLPAYYDAPPLDEMLGKKWVSKPLYGREG
jgi:glutathionylspermidine synthase